MSVEFVIDQPRLRRKGIEVVKQWTTREFRFVAILSMLHLPLGLILYNTGPIALLHPMLVFGAGLFAAVSRRVSLANVALVAAYIVGSEVLWRMASIPIYWESGKYMSMAILVIAMLRRRRYKIPSVPTAYFMLLVPSCLLIFAVTDLNSAFQTVSFTMSGPLLLVVCCWFFGNCRVRAFQLRRLLIAVILPLLSVAVTTLFYAVSNEDIQFTGESNFATSGGFGPNQVSSMLGLGVFLALAGLVLFKKRSRFGVYFAVSAVFLGAMSVLTFSRGGIYNAIGGILVLTLFHFRDLSSGVKRLAPLLILFAVFVLVIFPYLDAFTGGALEERFEDTGTTNRWEIIEADLEVFMEQPIFGVGIGQSSDNRKRFLGFGAVSHTELTRLLSEHGIFGLGALFFLVMVVAINLLRPNSKSGKAFIAGAAAWSFLFMMNAGMRLAAPSFMLGIACLTVANMRMFVTLFNVEDRMRRVRLLKPLKSAKRLS